MADGYRIYPVNKVVLHYSLGPEFKNTGDKEVSKWYSDIGRNRGYAGVAHSDHFDPYTGLETFSQAHYTLREYDLDGNKYGWRLTLLIKDPMNNVAWHAGNWQINQQSIGIEVCGDYTNKKLPEKALMLIADSFRQMDKDLGGWLEYHGHKEYAATACPGMIMGQIDTIYDMANNPDAWNKKLFPVTPPPATDPCESYKAEIVTLKADAIRLNKNVDELNGLLTKAYTDLQTSRADWLAEKEHSKTLLGELEGVKLELKQKSDDYGTLMIEKNTLRNQNENLIAEINTLKSGRFMWLVDWLEKLFPIRK